MTPVVWGALPIASLAGRALLRGMARVAEKPEGIAPAAEVRGGVHYILAVPGTAAA